MITLKGTSNVACIEDSQRTSKSYHHPTLDHEGPITLIKLGTLAQFSYKRQEGQASSRLIRISFVSYLCSSNIEY